MLKNLANGWDWENEKPFILTDNEKPFILTFYPYLFKLTSNTS